MQAELPSKFRVNDKRKTFVVQVGDALGTGVEQARERANVIIGRIRRGEDPRDRPPGERDDAWRRVGEVQAARRPEASHARDVRGALPANLEKWKDVTLRTLAMNPHLALDEHKAITERAGPSEADHAMRLLRSIYQQAKALDPSLPGIGILHRAEGLARRPQARRRGDSREGDADDGSGRSRSYARSCRCAQRSRCCCCASAAARTSLLAAEWPNVDLKRKVLWISDSKEEPYEVPLSPQAVSEFKNLREARALNRGDRDFVFPSRVGKRGHGHLAQYTEPKDVLLRTSNALRHTHHTLGTRLGVKEIVLDVLEGRSILKSGAAGRGYVDTHELGPELRKAQDIINQEIDRLFAGKGR